MKQRKNLAALALAGVLSASLVIPAAAVEPGVVTATLRPDTRIVIDGTERTFYNVKGQEVHAIYYQGSNYLPVRAIGELMGKLVNWDRTTKTVSLEGVRTAAPTQGKPDTTAVRQNISVELHPDFNIEVEGVVQHFQDATGAEVYPILYNGSNYLPVRAIGEMMGKTVSWDAATQSIVMNAPGMGGEVTDADSFGPSGTPVKPVKPSPDGKLISAADAKSAALAHAGLTASQVTMTQCSLKWDDGRQIYDVEFIDSNRKEYDYEIDAKTGTVLEWSYEVKPALPSNNGMITADQAKQLALAQVSGAKASDVKKCKLDREDGEYEIEIRVKGREYEIDLDAYTGEVLNLDVD